VEELFDLARALATQPAPRGRRLLIVTNGGGLGIVAADAARDVGLEVPALDDAVRRRLGAVLPAAASAGNPVDLVGDADAARYGNALHAAGPCADALLVLLTAQAATDALGVARAVLGATRDWPIPVVAAFVGGARVAPGARALEDAGVPCYPFPEPAVASLAGMATLAGRRQATASEPGVPAEPTGTAAAAIAGLRGHTGHALGLPELAPLLAAYGIRAAVGRPAATPEEARAAAAALGSPVALKVISPDISHKTDVGGVRLDLRTPDEVAGAFTAMLARVAAARPGAALHGAMVQPMVAAGKELLVGVVRDPQFGPLVVVGFGGIYVEVLGDTAARLAPVTPGEARAMLDELRMAPVLRGVRGEAPVDRDAVADAIARLSRLAVDAPELAEIELNPLMATAAGAVAVDARARLGRPGRDGGPAAP
jgi:acetyltransferase